jgi:inosine-uridine nucleoside N-ribohydrolase
MQLLVWLLVLALCNSAVLSTKVWLDVDISAGLLEKDVDDALCLLQCTTDASVDVLGVSVVFGNSDLQSQLQVAEVRTLLVI